MMQIRNRFALVFIRLARRLTTCGFVDDHLDNAEELQRGHVRCAESCLADIMSK